MIEIYKSHGRYYIIVPKVAFPTFVEKYVLPCRAHLEFQGFPLAFFTDAPGVLNVQFERAEPYTQTFWTMKRRHPNHWKLDSYLQMKPLRHSPNKKVFTNLNDLLREEDWVRELLKNGSGEPFDE
ncbi:hypothetical protein TNCV_2971251 [Trichonephila clavipes]|nr:hypothetical protein TNCV_2971251 [Trichonephila clavipes]